MTLRKTTYINSVAFVLVVLLCSGSLVLCRDTKEYKGFVLVVPATSKTAIRFNLFDGGDELLWPLVFRPVKEDDPKLNTVELTREGKTVYVLLGEMSLLLKALAQSSASWKESKKTTDLKQLDGISDDVLIDIASSTGIARAKIRPKARCLVLDPLDSIIKTPRALLEFQGFREFSGCKVPPDFDFAEWQRLNTPSFRKAVPPQLVDATPLI